MPNGKASVGEARHGQFGDMIFKRRTARGLQLFLARSYSNKIPSSIALDEMRTN